MNAGLQATYQQLSIDWDKFIFADQLAMEATSQEPSSRQPHKSYPDFSAGFMIGYRESIYLGFAAHHLTSPIMGFMQTQEANN
jgi:hypothetical protein